MNGWMEGCIDGDGDDGNGDGPGAGDGDVVPEVVVEEMHVFGDICTVEEKRYIL